MNHPKISIITPSFNQGKFLEETIVSVIGQDYPNLEYIVIDGGSTDQSVEIIRKYERRLQYWTSEKDNGQSEAINKGLRMCTGDIITWLNSDDLFTPGALRRAADCFQKNPDAQLIHGRTILFGDIKKEITKGADDADLDVRYFSSIPFPQPSSFFTRKVLSEQGLLDEQLHYGMDFDYLIRIALNYRIAKTEEIFSKYRMHAHSKSVSSSRNFAVDWAKVFGKFLNTFDTKRAWITVLKQAGIVEETNGSYSSGKIFPDAVLKKIVMYFLEHQLYIYYELLDMQRVKLISGLIRENDPEFFRERKLQKIAGRSSMLSPGIIRLLRKFSR
ncbi:MAG: glycosyltransferase family 2 protein [Bacteroidetes bacterium]|nr:glycosyltransferase family 2 protein [Bacteroidota bacterium]